MIQFLHYRVMRAGLSLIFLASLVATPAATGEETQNAAKQHATISVGDVTRTRSSNETPAIDDRIGQLWIRDQMHALQKRCTANHLSKNLWITAHHCVTNLDKQKLSGYIKQYDGSHAKITAIHTKTDTDDIALIEVTGGKETGGFILSNETLSIGSKATLVGYGGSHDYPSIAGVRVVAHHAKYPFGSVTYSNILETVATTDSWSCHGDSGGAVYSGDTIYAVHTAGGSNPLCRDRKNGKMWHTDLAPYKEWITSFMQPR